MIEDANLASEVLLESPIASELQHHGFTHAMMGKRARTLIDLRVRVEIAKAELLRATAELHLEGREFARVWSRFSNLVRALTADEALRTMHGVKTVGGHRPRSPRAPKARTPPTRPTLAWPEPPALEGSRTGNGEPPRWSTA